MPLPMGTAYGLLTNRTVQYSTKKKVKEQVFMLPKKKKQTKLQLRKKSVLTLTMATANPQSKTSFAKP